ncbi:MAG TPA: FtsQ-type POTRA domain-containing protein [Lacunisphaera sp.]|nr:FtsQ-type POTRA domain-containing protein [Lacunisphaera sp.]
MSSAREDSRPAPGRSWRDIRQEVSAPALSRRGRRRRLFGWLKFGTLAALAVAATWGAVLLVHEWRADRAALATATHDAPVKNILVITDGVLTRDWVAGVLNLPAGTNMMAVVLPALRDRLLEHGQVSFAAVTRSFPSTLVVTLKERTPVARVQASAGLGAAEQLLVARDGVVYRGAHYEAKLLASLPWLDGIRLVRTGNGFQPIAGMEDVAALLTTAQLQAPHLYRQWHVVSLAGLADQDEIVVRSQDVPEIIFSRKRDWFKQIAQLDYIIDRALLLPEPGLKSVNLALEGQVPVQLLHPPAELAHAANPSFSLQPSQPRVQSDL